MSVTQQNIAQIQENGEETANRTLLEASAPDASAWVSANAGAGKTYLLVARVKRLLLAGNAPSRILCLTYTRAAAAEMQARLMRELSAWAIMEYDTLLAELKKLTGSESTGEVVERAQTLFARLTDDAEGLRVQTIHSFCQSVLKRFPLEAGVEPHFTIMDDRTSREMLQEALRQLLSGIAQQDDVRLREAVEALAANIHESGFRELSAILTSEGKRYRALFAHYTREALLAEIYRCCDVQPEDTVIGLMHHHLAYDAKERTALSDVISKMQQSANENDQARAGRMASWLESPSSTKLEDYSDIWLTQAGTKRATIATKQAKLTDTEQEILSAEQKRVVKFTDKVRALHYAKESADMLVFVEGLMRRYDALKSSRALMDYDDIIVRAVQLLSADGSAAWVMYKLDEGIDHLLIDEAQDTSREQWKIAKALTEEYFAGEGIERPTERTLFVVGDEKQSIFSFQGAFPAGFGEMKEYFKESVTQAGKKWVDAKLPMSRRTVAPILALVDAVFHDAALIGANGELPRHSCHRAGEAGQVEIWPLVEPETQVQEKDALWQVPEGWQEADEPWHTLAAMIADTVEGWVRSGETLEASGKRITPGDIMVLVQRRKSEFVVPLIRELQKRSIAVAGIDRLKLAESLVVKDLVGLASFALLPEDDLNLASILKSPLLNIDEGGLFELANGRAKELSLWSYLRRQSQAKEIIPVLERLLERADYIRPYEFFMMILEEMHGRERILGRMGHAQLDIIEEFLNAVLLFEQSHTPSLQAFCHWLQLGENEIKRDMQSDADELRIMTVHGAKGLEAPIVFLPDTAHQPKARNEKKDRIAWDEAEVVSCPYVLPSGKDSSTHADRLRALQASAREEEYYRLLYVALTRARDRLYVCGVKGKNELSESCWYETVRRHCAELEGVETVQTPSGEGLQLHTENSKPLDPQKHSHNTMLSLSVPEYRKLSTILPPEDTGRVLSPSRLWEEDEPPAPSPQSKQRLYQRGTLVHKLLQYLPEVEAEKRAELASVLLQPHRELPQKEKESLTEETLCLLSHPDFTQFFIAGGIAEVPLVGTVQVKGESRYIAGQVDRLVIGEKDIWLIDYKTHAQPPESVENIPLAYLRQMAAYRALVAAIYPDKRLHTALLWTSAPSLTILPAELLEGMVST